jgi:SAM-dependent methyltransferase
MVLTEFIHDGYVHQRRVRRIGDFVAGLVPMNASVLDAGCGDGLLARRVQSLRPDVRFRGIDVLVREVTHIPVQQFDGKTIPEADGGVDVVQFIDVLHHTDDPMVMLREATRVARQGILIKDHTLDGLLAGPTLRFMDYVGNAHHGVRLPYHFWPKRRWHEAFRELGLAVKSWHDDLKLYPPPADWLFGRSLQFIAFLALDRPGK